MRSPVRLYVGLLPQGGRSVFRSKTIPTSASHGTSFNAVIGPFRTLRAANLMAQRACTFPNVAAAERAAKDMK
jgi:hypothetical protein